ncbi:D-sedoheptulose 7-phosphate isomerase [Polynucleobacter paludilacus]|uniref:D-sedoheptulose-7-phosphate isomerase n=1 Tax=Polynucleobacter paludilacus TaxID=1855895 RepID=UPI001BFE5E11|nr:D-sedoheptulose 7-phosphate isomerase [Polynucleobacter paludilacus]QWD87332.1 D-sedoheptulose 7-phosphate isomerase [Polynucleobacter paludilacus]
MKKFLLHDSVANIKFAIQDSIRVKQEVLNNLELLSTVDLVIDGIINTYNRGNKLIIAGNGGSAADAQHLAAEFVSRFKFDRPGLPAISLATDTSMITAIGNDYGFERLFLRQLQAQSRPGDFFVGITTSGRSPNVILALDACKELGVSSAVLCGLNGDLEGRAEYLLRVPSKDTPRIQECHILIGHIICEAVEQKIFGHLTPSGNVI